MYQKYIKRLLDIVVSFLAILIFSPVFLVLSILILIFLGKPILFKQQRPGKNEKIFKLYKFRTMTNKKDEKGNLLPDEKRLTKFGRFLRSTSLDECPEFFNILKGDMSFIGPRPLLVRDMTFMSKKIRERHNVYPGLTGLAQVNGRNALAWENKFKYDLKYINNISFKNDLIIVFKTIVSIFKREGIGEEEGKDFALDYGDYLLNNCMITKKNYELRQEESKKILANNDRKRFL